MDTEKTISADIKTLKDGKFITQVITPESLTEENITTYVTQVGIASKINLDAAANEPAPANVEPEATTKSTKSTKSTKKEEPVVEPEEELPVVDEPEVEE